jgi:archaeosortase A (PGF-CTERM-specific)
MAGPLTDAFAWVVIALFLAAAILNRRDHDAARPTAGAAWVAFAGFWLALFPHFAFEQRSYVEGLLSLAAVPACLYTGHLLYHGRDSLFVLSRAVAVMGLIYLPFETIPTFAVLGTQITAPRQVLIEVVAAQTGLLMSALGYELTMISGSEYGYMNTFRETTETGHIIQFTVVLACTGLGSMAIFGGLIAAVRAPLARKLQALAIAIPIIYVLNLLRTTFIGIVFTQQLMQWQVDWVLTLFGASDPYTVSFLLSDRVISQTLAVVALVGITFLIVRRLPELLTVVEDVLFMITGDEHDLADDLGVQRLRADGAGMEERADGAGMEERVDGVTEESEE